MTYNVANDKAYTLFIVYPEQVELFEKDYLVVVVAQGNSISEVLLNFEKIRKAADTG